MIKCLIVSSKPYLFDALKSLYSASDMLVFEYSDNFKPGFDLIITDENFETEVDVIALTERPIELSKVIENIDNYINAFYKKLQFSDVILDVAARNIVCNDISIPLTETECKILSSLIKSDQNILSREEIKTSILGYNEQVQTSTIENHIYHLRQKLSHCNCKTNIETRESGYILLA